MASIISYTKAALDSLLGGKSDTGHIHDDRYFTETEVNSSLATKVAKAGDTMTGPLRGGTATDVLGAVLEILRNNIQIGRIDNNAGGVRIQAQSGSLQLRGVNNTGIAIDANGVADFAATPTVAGVALLSDTKALPRKAPVSGRSRAGHILPSGSWTFVDANVTYFYPVYYETTFGVAGFGVHLRGQVAGGTCRLGLYANTPGDFMPGVVQAQTSIAMDTAGWKEANITAVTGLPAGWYWHASNFSAQLDVFCLTEAWGWEDGPTMENAIRQDSLGTRSRASSMTGVLTSNPASGPHAHKAPSVGVKFA